MNMTLSITISAPEMCCALNNIAAALGQSTLPVQAPLIAAMCSAEATCAPLVAVVAATPAAPDVTTTVSVQPVAPLTVDQVKTLAALKAKTVGAAVVKGIIADAGAATIGDIKDPLVLASLAANLEAL